MLIPMLAVMYNSRPPTECGAASKARSFSATRVASFALSISGSSITNSSPPWRVTVSVWRKPLRLGYKIKRGQRRLRLSPHKIQSGVREGDLYAYPKGKSIRRFMDQVRERTKRRVPLKTPELIANLNPVIRGWGNYYKRAHVRKLFNRLNGWIVHRIRSHRCKRWRNRGWRQLPETRLYGEYGLVNLVQLIPSIASRKRESS